MFDGIVAMHCAWLHGSAVETECADLRSCAAPCWGPQSSGSSSATSPVSSAGSSPPLASGTVLTPHDYFVTVFIELNILLSMCMLCCLGAWHGAGVVSPGPRPI